MNTNTLTQPLGKHSIAAVIPCFQERDHILDVIAQIGNEVNLGRLFLYVPGAE